MSGVEPDNGELEEVEIDWDQFEPEVEVAFAGGYYFGQLERIIRDAQPLLAINRETSVRVRLERIAFIGPTALAFLLAVLQRLSMINCTVQVYPPANPLTRRYLERMDFKRLFMEQEEIDEDFERKPAVGFRPVVHFTTLEECTVASRELSDALIERAPTDSAARGAIKAALHELAENVIYHADSLLGGYAAATYSKKRQEIEIGIIDLGIGIRASLVKNTKYADIADDVTAVKKAMIPTVSSTPERNSGYGLAFTQLLLLGNGGSLRIRSGLGAAAFGPGVDYSARDTEMPGTLVVLRARTDRPLDAKHAWDALEEAIENVLANGSTASDDSARR